MRFDHIHIHTPIQKRGLVFSVDCGYYHTTKYRGNEVTRRLGKAGGQSWAGPILLRICLLKVLVMGLASTGPSGKIIDSTYVANSATCGVPHGGASGVEVAISGRPIWSAQ